MMLTPEEAGNLYYAKAVRLEGSFLPWDVIEWNLLGVVGPSGEELKGLTPDSHVVREGMGPEIQWLEGHVTGDEPCCTHIASNNEMGREHAPRRGFPPDRISEVRKSPAPPLGESSPPPRVA